MFGRWNEDIFAFLNGMSGRSSTLDALLALAVDNPVVKAGPIIACFIYAWWTAGAPAQQTRRRSVLLVSLASLFVIAPVMKVITTGSFSPRPLVQSEQVYTAGIDGKLKPLPLQRFRPPATGEAAARYEALGSGEIDENDFGSFPSDHAALFVALAVGIFIAARAAGAIALAWALCVTLGARVITGLHWPVDVFVGGLVGAGSVIAAVALSLRLRPRLLEWLVNAAGRWPGISAALIVVALFEVAQTMATLERLAELGRAFVSGGA